MYIHVHACIYMCTCTRRCTIVKERRGREGRREKGREEGREGGRENITLCKESQVTKVTLQEMTIV